MSGGPLRSFLIPALLASALLLAVPAHGQDSKVITGIVAYQQNDFEAAVGLLDAALAHPDVLKPKNLAKAHFYRAKARLGILTQAQRTKEGNAHLEALVPAMDDLLAARDLGDKRLSTEIDREIDRLADALLASAYAIMQAPDGAATSASLAEPWLDRAILARPDDHRAYEIRGQVRLAAAGGVAAASGEVVASARADFEESLKVFAAHPPERPDPMVPMVHYRLALLARVADEDIGAALDWIAKGLSAADALGEAIEQAKRTQPDTAALEQTLQTVANELRTFELDCYLNAPDRRVEAIAKFEAAAKREPGNALLWVALASLLEASDPDRAVKSYEKAYELDPKQYAALFNLGAHHTNVAAGLLMKANEAEDYAASSAFAKQAMAALAESAAWFEKAHAVDPTDVNVLRALESAYLQLERNDDHVRIKALRTKLQGG